MPIKNSESHEPSGLIQLKADLQAQFGVMLDHVQLRQVLGYRTASAFQRAIELGRLGPPVFNVPGRRGKFALTADVAEWLWRAREQSDPNKGGAP